MPFTSDGLGGMTIASSLWPRRLRVEYDLYVGEVTAAGDGAGAASYDGRVRDVDLDEDADTGAEACLELDCAYAWEDAEVAPREVEYFPSVSKREVPYIPLRDGDTRGGAMLSELGDESYCGTSYVACLETGARVVGLGVGAVARPNSS